MNRRLQGLLLVAAAMILASRPASATWQIFDRSSGLPSEFITTMAEDRDENLWIGTYVGLARYDGVTWRTYRTRDGLPSDAVSALFCDPAGPVWIGTNQGLARFDGTNWRTFTTADGLPTNFISCIAQDTQGRIWVGTNDGQQGTGLGGVARFDGISWQSFTTADGLPSNSVNAIACTRNGETWVGTYFGVSRYNGSVWTSEPDAGSPANIHEDRQGRLWFAGGGLALFDGSTWRYFGYLDGLPSYGLVIGEDEDGGIWTGATSEYFVARFDGTRWNPITSPTDPIPGYLTTILGDRSGNLWFGSIYRLTRYDRSRWERIEVVNNDVNCALVDSAGKVWLGMEGAGAMWIDGTSSGTFTMADGLPGNRVKDIVQAPGGALWFAMEGSGVARLEDSTWTTFTTNEGLPSAYIGALTVDHLGHVWCGGTQGVGRFDGSGWVTYMTAGAIPITFVLAIEEDSAGNIWVGTGDKGALKFDGVGWSQYTTADGLGTDEVQSIFCDRSGAVWFGTDGGGVSRFDGTTWTRYTSADGLASTDDPRAITQDRSGVIWVASNGGASRFDGERWQAFAQAAGLQNQSDMSDIVEDGFDRLWFASASDGVTQYDPDRVGPQTVLVSRPPALSSGRQQTGAALAAFGEAAGVEYSTRLDGGAWSPWSVSGLWSASSLSDGNHSMEIRARDWLGNVDRTPAVALFEVDATAPAPFISSPVGGFVRGQVAIQGTTWDARFSHATLTFLGPSSESTRVVVDSLHQGDLTVWDTNSVPDGEYQIVLTVYDTLGLAGTTTRRVTVDNQFPPAEQSTPARIVANLGGDVYNTNAEVHLYFPPRAFAEDAVVMVTPAVDPAIPAWTLPPGTVRVLTGSEIAWGGAPLRKAARLELSYGVAHATERLAVYQASDSTWVRLGGTMDPKTARISLAITAPGVYALFVESGVPSGTGTLGALAFTPRVFSPTGAFASNEVGISFTLGRPAPVTVRVYSRSGRLVREVVTGQAMNAGANLVRWDGRDRNGGYAVDGLYLVTVEALGRTERKTLAVVK